MSQTMCYHTGTGGTIMIPLMVPILSDCMPALLLGRSSGLVLFAFGVGPAIGYAITGR